VTGNRGNFGSQPPLRLWLAESGAANRLISASESASVTSASPVRRLASQPGKDHREAVRSSHRNGTTCHCPPRHRRCISRGVPLFITARVPSQSPPTSASPARGGKQPIGHTLRNTTFPLPILGKVEGLSARIPIARRSAGASRDLASCLGHENRVGAAYEAPQVDANQPYCFHNAKVDSRTGRSMR
jgi:hypothetical protein